MDVGRPIGGEGGRKWEAHRSGQTGPLTEHFGERKILWGPHALLYQFPWFLIIALIIGGEEG